MFAAGQSVSLQQPKSLVFLGLCASLWLNTQPFFVGQKTERPVFGPASQGWRRHSASIGYRPHPGNHIHRYEDFSQNASAVNSTVVVFYYQYDIVLPPLLLRTMPSLVREDKMADLLGDKSFCEV